MASTHVTIDTRQLLRDLQLTADDVTIGRLAELLQLSPEAARDWLICKVAQFRAMSESDIAALLAPAPLGQQSQTRGDHFTSEQL